MNAVMRSYWLPVLLSTDLERDGDPKLVTLLGEQYVAFRDSNGEVGFLEANCCHRGVLLSLGRNEECGLRCLYHGWKFAVDGRIMDTPNVPDPQFKTRFRQPAFPAREAGDLIWVFVGDPDKLPPFCEYEYMRVPAEQRMVVRMDLDCNYLQALEGGLDTSHISQLHRNRMVGKNERLFVDQEQRRKLFGTDEAPRVDVRETEFGLHYAAFRKTNDGTENDYVRVTAYVAPITLMIPPRLNVLHFIPIDDTHTGKILIHWSPDKVVDRDYWMEMDGLNIPGVWENNRILQSIENGFLQNRQSMREGTSWSGLPGVTTEDIAMNLAQGPIADRSKEILVQADSACIQARRYLLDAIARVEEGKEPPGLRPTSPETVAAVDFSMEPGGEWWTHVPGNLEVTQEKVLTEGVTG